MHEPVSALKGARFEGFAQLREIGPLGMITLRAKPGTVGLEAAIMATTGCALPALRRVELAGARGAGWMSPDEFLLILPYEAVAEAMAVIAQTLAGQHHLAVDVSDARAVFRIDGDKADQVLRKLSPTDFDLLPEGVLHRTRLAQVGAAFWRDDLGYQLVCFRSVARYVMGLLQQAAQPGSEL